jgi:hypothetical protein
MLHNLGKPELRRNPSFLQKSLAKKVDARVKSAFTRVFDALLPAHDGPMPRAPRWPFAQIGA